MSHVKQTLKVATGLTTLGGFMLLLSRGPLVNEQEDGVYLASFLRLLRKPIHASTGELHPAQYPWPHRGYLQAFDHAR
jgi:hypothetical protein